MILNASMGNGAVVELSSCVINNVPCIIVFGTFLEQIYLLTWVLYYYVSCTYMLIRDSWD